MNVIDYDVRTEEFNWDLYEKSGDKLIPNNNIIKDGGLEQDKITVYCHEQYAQESFDQYMRNTSVTPRKDVAPGECVKVTNIPQIKGTEITLELECGIRVDVDITKEKNFYQIFGYESATNFIESIKTGDNLQLLLNHDIHVLIMESTPSLKVSLWQGYHRKLKEELLQQIQSPSKAYIARVNEANNGGYFVDIHGVKAFMPGSLAAPNKINDFMSLVGKEVTVMVEDYLNDMNSFIVSHKKYVNHILPIKIKELDLEKQYTGKVTGASKYGVFVEFEDIFTGLLHVSKMNEDTKEAFNKRLFKPDDQISFYINEITKDNRIILTEESPIEKRSKIDEFLSRNEGKVIPAKIVARTKFGVIISVESLTGLIINDDLKGNQRNNINIGDIIDVKYKEEYNNKLSFIAV